MADVLIIGGGPAGLTAAIYLARAGRDVLLFEGNRTGGTLARLNKIVNFPGSVSDDGAEIASRMTNQMLSFGVKVVPSFVSKVIRQGDKFVAMTDTETFEGSFVIYCGGLKRNKPVSEDKFKGSGISYCAVCDGNFFRGKTVAVIGDGEAANSDVRYLLPLCKKVYHVFTTSPAEGAEGVKGVVSEFLGDSALQGIRVGNRVIEVDGAFIAMGGVASEIIKGLQIKDGLIVTDECKTNIDGFFVAGDARLGSMRQVVSACYDGALVASYIINKK